MRKKMVAGNWKMNLNLQDGVALATNVKDSLANDKPHCDVVVCTPFIHLASVAQVLKGSVVGLGAENCADKEKGAYTGEVSAEMVKSTGAQYVILGHSERRQYYGETAESAPGLEEWFESHLLLRRNFGRARGQPPERSGKGRARRQRVQSLCRRVEEHCFGLRTHLGHRNR